MKPVKGKSAPARQVAPQHRLPNAPAIQAAPPDLVEITKPVYGGQFLAHLDGKAVFVPFALPGEQVHIRVQQSKSGYLTAELREIATPSPLRIAPTCPYFGACGGCNYQHTGYENQLVLKQEVLRETLARGGAEFPGDIDVLAASPWAYRNRVRLAIDAEGNTGYRSRGSHAVIPISQCPIAAPLLLGAAHQAADYLARVPKNLRPTEMAFFSDPAESALLATFFVSESAGVRLQPLADALHERIPQLRGAELAADGRPGHPPRTLAQWGQASMIYPAAGFEYRVDHGAFFQVNRWLIDALVEAVTSRQAGCLAWDLFAGVGLFARKLASRFERVVAVESASASKAALLHNLHGTTGHAVHADTLQFLRSHSNLSGPDKPVPDLIVLDPPRSGLGAEVTALLAAIASPALIYVSCDPATLARDLRALIHAGYRIESITLADLFPQTFHLESIVHLRRT
jgi:23S rRNA (uracil1939-C5)-methyltransferase